MDDDSTKWLYGLRFAYLLALPPAAIWILHQQGWRVSVWVALVGAIAILITVYLRAALTSTEGGENQARGKELLRWALVVALVGLSASFEWERWIVEQLLLEIAAFSVAIAIIAVCKAAEEGGLIHGPWLMVLVMFVLPAVGLVSICLQALLYSAGGQLEWIMAIPLLVALVVAVYEGVRKLGPYTIGSQQLKEPISGGFQLVLLVVWFVALLIGMPLLLGEKAG